MITQFTTGYDRLTPGGLMKSNLLLFVLLSIFVSTGLLSACGLEDAMPEVSHITYTLDPGAILPEHRAQVEYLIKSDGILLSIQGRSVDTQVIEGQWKYPVDEQVVRDLFDLAAEKRCSDYKRIESPIPPDGGGSETILLSYSNGETCSLYYDPGTTYTGAEDLIESIRQIVRSLDPASAVIIQ